MSKRRIGTVEQELLEFLESVCGSRPRVLSLGPPRGTVQIAACREYPRAGLCTFVTLGASDLRASMYRGRPVGFEIALTLGKDDPDIIKLLRSAVVENARLAATRERRPFIEYNGVYAPGYPPHLLFTQSVALTPALSKRKLLGGRYVSFLAAIPLDDAELRNYDRNVSALLEQLQAGGRVADFPRRD